MEIHHSPYDSYGGDLLFAPQQIARDLLFLLGQIWLFNVYVAYVSCTPQVHCVCNTDSLHHSSYIVYIIEINKLVSRLPGLFNRLWIPKHS